MRTLVRGLAVIASATLTLGIATSATAGISPAGVTVTTGSPAGVPVATVATSTTPVNITAGVAWSCSSVIATGSITPGDYPGYPTSAFATIDDSTWSGCTWPLGLNMSVTQSGPWNIVATGSTGTPGVTPVRVTGISVHWQDTDYGGTLCSFEMTGSIDGAFDNSSQQLNVTGSSALVVSNVSGCLGLIQDNGPASFTGSFDVKDASTNVHFNPPITLS